MKGLFISTWIGAEALEVHKHSQNSSGFLKKATSCSKATAKAPGACPAGWKCAGAMAYKGADREMKFGDAMAWCGSLSSLPNAHATVAVVTDDVQNKLVQSIFPDKGVWLGITDSAHEGHWHWVNNDISNTYIKWGPDEPNNMGGEDCVHLRGDGTWNDNKCSAKQRVVCSMPVPPMSAKEAISAYACIPGWQCSGGYAYQVIADKEKTWQDAKAYCEGEMETVGMPIIDMKKVPKPSLGIIENSDQNMLGVSMMHGFKNSMWIGLSDTKTEGKWEWEQERDEDSIYTAWNRDEPNDWGGGEDCTTLKTNGKWNDLECSSKRPFLCSIKLPQLPPSLDERPYADCGGNGMVVEK